jgi:hypothetical protein
MAHKNDWRLLPPSLSRDPVFPDCDITTVDDGEAGQLSFDSQATRVLNRRRRFRSHFSCLQSSRLAKKMRPQYRMCSRRCSHESAEAAQFAQELVGAYGLSSGDSNSIVRCAASGVVITPES